MSINGISNGYAQRPLPSSTQTVREQGVRPHGSRIAPATPLVGQTPLRAVTAAPGGAAALPVQAPSGTDPALWSILTSEERGFFAKSQASGPLTYGRLMAERSQPSLPAVRGGRLDIRG